MHPIEQQFLCLPARTLRQFLKYVAPTLVFIHIFRENVVKLHAIAIPSQTNSVLISVSMRIICPSPLIPSPPTRPTRPPRHTISICRGSIDCDVAVVGGGAAGLTAAFFAATQGARVTVLERNADPGRKITISGGTRCNVLPEACDVASDFYTESSLSALRSIFSKWSLEECRQWLSDPGAGIGIPLTLEADTKKIFPASNSAHEVRDKLVAACLRQGVDIIRSTELLDLRQSEGQGCPRWECCCQEAGTRGGLSLRASRVVLATGGMSFPNLGSTGVGFEVLKRLGHTLYAPYPALTPLLGQHPSGGQGQLPGISLYDAQLTVVNDNQEKKSRNSQKGRRAHRSAVLLTHRGFSGPAVLDLSHHYAMAEGRGLPLPKFVVSWTKEMDKDGWSRVLSGDSGGASLVINVLKRSGLPARLADALCSEADVPSSRKLSELRKEERHRLVEALSSCALHVTGHEGYLKAEVTGGGISLSELNCDTMESRRTPRLYVCGELCDVHGRIGGFNFFWAWCSGRLAGLSAGRKT